MKGSFLRLVVTSVLVFWLLGFLVVVLYARSLDWTEEMARSEGVFLAHELLDEEPASIRARRLDELRPHFAVGLDLLDLEEVERRVSRTIRPGETIWYKRSERAEYYIMIFGDGTGGLIAGPVNPGIPTRNYVPIGVLLAVFGLPIIVAFVVVRVQTELNKVERASQALATGEFSARVDNLHGPSRELAASFNEMAERVERLIRSRDELVQAVSHELGSPLSRLRFHMELLNESTGAQREERQSAMSRELDALDDLVAELLSYVQSDEMKIEPRSFDPDRSLEDLAELARLEAPEDRTVEVEVKRLEGVQLFADPRLFQRAVENLLRNAVQHARRTVQVELSESADEVRIAVHDDGPGIPEGLREKVKIPFFRPEADRDRKKGGAGLGLAIVTRIMQRHGGRLDIGTSPMGGATVSTSWPRHRVTGPGSAA